MDGLFLPKLYGVYDSPKIEWEKLPSKFVIKCNHGCGFNILCPNKEMLDKKASEKLLKEWMKDDYWKEYCEVQYKYVKKKIIVEEYLGDDLECYKFYCFNGKPKVCYVSSMGETGIRDYYIDYFDMEWNRMHHKLRGHEHYSGEIKKPYGFEDMIRIAKELSKDFPFVRIDLYDVGGKIYISEFTFIPTGGFMHLEPEGVSEEWGRWLEL